MYAPGFLTMSPGLGEIVAVLIVVLLLFGAERLPGIARSMGHWLRRIRNAADDFHDQLLDADRDTSRELSATGATHPEDCADRAGAADDGGDSGRSRRAGERA